MEKTWKAIVEFIRELYGEPTRPIPLHEPRFLGNEKKYLADCIDSTYVSSVGPYVERFEKMVAEYTGTRYAVATVNGTSALHIALLLAGVKPGDEVITQPLTFVATANAIVYCGAQPVFLDVDRSTLGLSPDSVLQFLEKHTRYDKKTNSTVNKVTKRRITACLPMHTFGHPCRIDQIIEICTKYNIPVVEDAAESLGSFYKEKHTGTFGLMGVLSFNGNKIITTGGGGMILTDDENLAKRARHLTTQAKVTHPWEFVHDEIGYNYRMPNINASLGVAQIDQMNLFIESKRNIASSYKVFFNEVGIVFIAEPPDARANYWLNSIKLKDHKERDDFLQFTNDRGILTRPAWRLMYHQEKHKKHFHTLTNTAANIESTFVNLPSSVII